MMYDIDILEEDGDLTLVKKTSKDGTVRYLVMLSNERQMVGNPNYDSTNAGLYKRKADALRFYNKIKRELANG